MGAPARLAGIWLFAAAALPAASARADVVFEVDPQGRPGPARFATIADALLAAESVPQPERVTIRVAPGTHLLRDNIRIRRDHTTLAARSDPIFARDGTLQGYRRGTEVRLVAAVDLDTDFGAIDVHASHVTVRGFTLEGGGYPRNVWVLGIRASGHEKAIDPSNTGDRTGERTLEGLLISENTIRDFGNGPIWLAAGSGTIARNRLLGPGYAGIFVTGCDLDVGGPTTVRVVDNFVQGFEGGLQWFPSSWEAYWTTGSDGSYIPTQSEGQSHGPSRTRLLAEGNVFLDATPFAYAGFFLGYHFEATLRPASGGDSPDADVDGLAILRDNRFGASTGYPIEINAGYGEVTTPTDVRVIFEDGNRFVRGVDPQVEAWFFMRLYDEEETLRDLRVTVIDRDGLIDAYDLTYDPGTPGSRFVLRQPGDGR